MSFKPIFLFLIIFSFSVFSYAQDKPYKLIIFEGSDWCSNCIRFDKKILSQQIFKDSISEHNIVVERIDFPQRKTQDKSTQAYNSSVADRHNFKGIFPTILIVDASSKIVANIAYQNQDAITFTALITSKIPAN